MRNCQKVRLLPSASWSHEPDRIEVGQDGTVHAKQVDNLKNDKFQVFVAMEKDMDAAAAKGDLGSLRTHTLEFVETDIDRYGRQCQIPVELGYASSIHKSQGSTEPLIHACIENIWAHGMTYVVTSRTRLEENLCCIGVPPQDLAENVATTVWDARQRLRNALEVWKTLNEEDRDAFLEHEHVLACPFCAGKSPHEKLLHDVLHDKQCFAEFRLADGTRALMESEIERLNPSAGLQKMLAITGNFKEDRSSKDKGYMKHNEIQSRRAFADRMKNLVQSRRTKKQKEWLTLLQILRPDELAWETYK